MKIRTKVFLIVVIVFGMLFFGISTIFTNIETANFEKLERQSVKDNMSRVDLALEGRFDDLSVKLSDWSMWDDTYEFAEDRNAEYIESNLQSETLPQLRLNFILIKNSAGETIFEKYILNNQETPLPEDLERIFLNPRIEAIGKGNTFDKIAGIVNTENGPFILAVQSITSSDGGAIPKGYISFGFVADENFTASLSKATVLKLEHSTVENASKHPLFVEAKKKLNLSSHTYINEDPNEDVISGFVLVNDIFGEPAVIFRADVPRDIHKVGLENTKRLDMFLIGIGIFEVFIILMLFEFFVLRKIYKLVQGVKLVSSKNHKTERLVVEGKDEFTKLNKEINAMLDAISATLAEKKESESRFMNIADTAPVMIWVSDSFNKIIYVNNALTKFLGKSEEELFGDAWTNVIHPDDKEHVLAEYRLAMEKQEPLSVKYRIINARGEYKWILVEAATRMTSQGIFRGYIGTAIDVTLFEEADSKKSEYISEIERLNALIRELELKVVKLEKK